MTNHSPHATIEQLAANREVFQSLLNPVTGHMAIWKPSTDCWSVLEITCHLCDEEREDFAARMRSMLDDPSKPLTPIDPQGWVESRDYASQDFALKVDEFLSARNESIEWLRSLQESPWDQTILHESFGTISALFFLNNWLAHDYLHIRQINRRKYEYLREHSQCAIEYAGDW